MTKNRSINNEFPEDRQISGGWTDFFCGSRIQSVKEGLEYLFTILYPFINNRVHAIMLSS